MKCTLQDFTPALSDLVKDWVEAEGWPVTIKPSKSVQGVWWVESKINLPAIPGGPPVWMADTATSVEGPVYIGAIRDDEAAFSPSPNDPAENLRAEDPEFFTKLAASIRFVFSKYKISIDLPNE